MNPMIAPRGKRAMTLMETVIAIGIVAFAVPLVLAAMTAGMEGRRRAEAETRAAWIADEVAREVANRWATPARSTYLPASLTGDFPIIGSSSQPWVLLFDSKSEFVRTGNAEDLMRPVTDRSVAVLAAVHATRADPSTLTPSSKASLSRLTIRIQMPVRAPKEKRDEFSFTRFITQTSPS